MELKTRVPNIQDEAHAAVLDAIGCGEGKSMFVAAPASRETPLEYVERIMRETAKEDMRREEEKKEENRRRRRRRRPRRHAAGFLRK